MKRRVGLHIRLVESLAAAAEKAVRLELPFFQCFFTRQDTGTLMQFTDQEIALFLKEYREHFTELYLHGSYWINLAGIKKNGYRSFEKEIELAKKMSFTHMVVHPGSAKGAQHKKEGIDAFAVALNKILKYEHDIQLVIENTAHGKMTVGSDINDFKLLLEKIDHPEKLTFALDTAHAFVYGYDMSTDIGQDAFIQLVDDAVGLERVSLIHLNDSSKGCGSCIDKHAVLGEGLIGELALKRFATNSQLAAIPMLLELPIMAEEQEYTIVEKVRSWF
ncbi:MAG: deoxyribonuclease IV [Candidatus Dependentiae bacterium]|nr:deoxyribonuclease IV [Candidatus Dependentiae bacterium]